MARLKRKIVEYEEEPFFDFGACVVVWLMLGACALGCYAAFLR